MTTCDILIIGGGIAGIGAGAMASADASVTVLESETAIGYHASGRSAAIFVMNYGNATLRALNAASIGMFEDPGDLTDAPLLSPRGEMMFASQAQLPLLDAYAEGATGLQRLTGAEACALAPILRPELVAAALYEPDARDIDADALLHGFARRLRRNGGRIECGAPAQAITHDGALWQVETPRGTFRAPTLVNAAGAWADEVAQLAGIAPVGLTPMRRSAALVPLPDGMDPSRWPLFVDAEETFYAKPMAGKLMVSPADEDPVAPHDAWADDMVIAEGLDRFERATTVPVTRVERPWAGLRTFAPDRRPVVGFADDPRRFVWLAGQGGYGVQTAPAMSQLAADICAGRPPALDARVCASMAPGRISLTE
jgi:D-arginine dehydrogenase